MAKNASNKKQDIKHNKSRPGDTDRTSSQGRKSASGGSKETNNRGHRKEE